MVLGQQDEGTLLFLVHSYIYLLYHADAVHGVLINKKAWHQNAASFVRGRENYLESRRCNEATLKYANLYTCSCDSKEFLTFLTTEDEHKRFVISL